MSVPHPSIQLPGTANQQQVIQQLNDINQHLHLVDARLVDIAEVSYQVLVLSLVFAHLNTMIHIHFIRLITEDALMDLNSHTK